MSIIAIRAALETALNGMTPQLATAWENTAFTPAVGTPYQKVVLMLAEPDNSESGARYIEQGYMQVDLRYPLSKGTADAGARAVALRTTFKRGLTFTSGGINVVIERTPQIMPGRNDEDRYVVQVCIRFTAQVSG